MQASALLVCVCFSARACACIRACVYFSVCARLIFFVCACVCVCVCARARVDCACRQALATCMTYIPSPPRPSVPLHPSLRPCVPRSPALSHYPSLRPSLFLSLLRPSSVPPFLCSSIPPHAHIQALARTHIHTHCRPASATSTTPSTPFLASWPTVSPPWTSTSSTTKGGSAKENQCYRRGAGVLFDKLQTPGLDGARLLRQNQGQAGPISGVPGQGRSGGTNQGVMTGAVDRPGRVRLVTAWLVRD